jgi:hypothetical protein
VLAKAFKLALNGSHIALNSRICKLLMQLLGGNTLAARNTTQQLKRKNVVSTLFVRFAITVPVAAR